MVRTPSSQRTTRPEAPYDVALWKSASPTLEDFVLVLPLQRNHGAPAGGGMLDWVSEQTALSKEASNVSVTQ
jgi:hypothetical protein